MNRQILNPLGMVGSIEQRPTCFKSNPGYQARAENDCFHCAWTSECLIAGTTVESRPAVHFPTMTDEELITYSESFAGTKLEMELTKRLVIALDEKVPSEDGYCQVCGNPV